MRSVAKEEKSQRNWEELSGPDKHHVRAAEGWLDFGLVREAAEELSAIKVPSDINPVVLKMHLRLWCQASFQLHNWENLLRAARIMVTAAPESQLARRCLSGVLSNIGRVDEALKLFLEQSDCLPALKGIFSDLELHAAHLRE